MPLPAVDVHAHVWLDTVEQAAMSDPRYLDARALELRRLGAESIAESAEVATRVNARLTEVDARLDAMDHAGVDVQLVSISPTQYHTFADADLASHVVSLTHAGIAAHCSQAAGRLIGLGVVPMQHPDGAVRALEDAVLDHKLSGVEISSHAVDPNGNVVELSDRRLDPLWQRAIDLDAVVFLHPWGCTLDERLNKWYLGNSVGQPVEHAVALSHLILAGVLDRFPALRLIAAHGGGYLPAFIGRADHAWSQRRDAHGCDDPPSSYLRRMWFDSLVHTPTALHRLIETVGSDRVVLGSDFPFDMGDADPIGNVKAARLGDVAEQAVIGGNALSLGLMTSASISRRT